MGHKDMTNTSIMTIYFSVTHCAAHESHAARQAIIGGSHGSFLCGNTANTFFQNTALQKRKHLNYTCPFTQIMKEKLKVLSLNGDP